MHARRFGYPPDVVERAWAAARWLLAALDEGRQPFGGGYRHWLDQVGGAPDG